MPPPSEAARKFWWWARNNPADAAKRGIKPSVAKEFTDADPGGKLPTRVKDGKPVNASRSPQQRRFGSLG